MMENKKRYLVRFDFGLYNAFGQELQLLTEESLSILNSHIGKHLDLGEVEGEGSDISGTFEIGDFVVMATYKNNSKFVKEWDKQFPQGFGVDIWAHINEGYYDGE